MRQKKYAWLFIFIFLFQIICGLPTFASTAAAGNDGKVDEQKQEPAKQRTVRVGYPLQKGLTEVTKDGIYRGYSYDYLKEIAKYTNWKYEFVQVDGTLDEQLVQLMDMLKKGEIDLMGAMSFNTALMESYDFPGYSYGTAYYVLCTLASNTEISITNYYQKPELKVLVINSQKKNNEKLEEFAKMSGLTVTQVFCDTEEEAVQYLEEGKADLLLAKDIGLPDGDYKIITSFSPTPYYFATTQGNKEIVNELNSALDAIKEYNPYLEINLRDKYFPVSDDALNFSQDEKKYIEKAGTLKVLAMGGMPAIQDVDDKTGSPAGVFMNVLEYVEEQTGLDFEVYMTESMEEYEKMIGEGNVDLVIGELNDDMEYGGQRLVTTTPFLIAAVSIVRSEGSGIVEEGKERVAATRDYPEFSMSEGDVQIYYDTVEECLDAVSSGKADYTVVNIYTLQYYMSKPNSDRLVSIPTNIESTRNYCFGISGESSPGLLGILNKTIQHFNRQDLMKNYLYRNAYQPEEMTLLGYVKAKPRETLTSLLILVLILTVAVLIVWRIQERNRNRIRQIENERYERLSEISNEFLFEYHIQKDLLKVTGKSAQFLRIPKEIENFSRKAEQNPQLAKLVMQKKSLQSEVQMDLPEDGGSRWLKIIIQCVSGNSGEPIYEVGKIIDIQQEREEKEKLKHRAEKDALTGLYYADMFWTKARQLSADQAGVLFVADVDRFKLVNDTYGHLTGDLVLEEIGRILQQEFSFPDQVAGRLGGDEFGMWIANPGEKEQIEEKCGNVWKAIHEITFPEQQEPISMSIGATLVEQGEEDMEKIYQQADQALYAVKTSQRGNLQVYQETESVCEERTL